MNMIKYTNHASLAPMARPWRLQIACGITLHCNVRRPVLFHVKAPLQPQTHSPNSSTALTEITMAMTSGTRLSRNKGNASMAVALLSSSVTSRRWWRFTSGAMRLACRCWSGFPPTLSTCSVVGSSESKPNVRPLNMPPSSTSRMQMPTYRKNCAAKAW